MIKDAEQDQFGNDLFLAGERVGPGCYRHLDSSHVVELEHEDVLPATLDGCVTCYVRVQTWSDIHRQE